MAAISESDMVREEEKKEEERWKGRKVMRSEEKKN